MTILATRSKVLQLANVVIGDEVVILNVTDAEESVELSITGAYGNTLELLFDALVLLFGTNVIEGDFGDTFVYSIRKG